MNDHKIKMITAGDDAESGTIFRKERVRRNDLCPCGSGKKAKRCCGTDANYTYRRHVNYIVKESELREDLRFKYRKDDKGKTIKISRWCYNCGQLVVVNENCTEKDLIERKAIIVDRGVCHDYFTPYYSLEFEDSDRKSFKWVNENYLSPIIF